MRLADGDVEFGRGLCRIIRGVLDDQTFLGPIEGGRRFFQRLGAPGNGEPLQAKIAADAMLEMDDVIAFFEVCKINFQQRARRLRVR